MKWACREYLELCLTGVLPSEGMRTDFNSCWVDAVLVTIPVLGYLQTAQGIRFTLCSSFDFANPKGS